MTPARPIAAASVAAQVAPSEAARRRVVGLVLLLYMLLLGEGALRKWLLPAYSQPLFFVRDPLLLIVYWTAFRHDLWPRSSPLLTAGVAAGLVASLLAVVQLLGGSSGVEQPLLLAAYGWRNYFLYLPLAFVVEASFQRADLERVIRMTLWWSVPVAALIVLQFFAPLDSPINVGTATEATQQFRGLGLTEEHTRPMGLFTSDLGQKEFTISCVAMLLAVWLAPARRVPLALIAVGAASTLVCLAFGGSRGAMLHAGLVFVLGVPVATATKGPGRRAMVWATAIVAVAAILYPILLPEGYAAFTTRWTSAFEVDRESFQAGVFGRAVYDFVDFSRLLGDTPLAGYGLGLGGNASTSLGASIGGAAPLMLAESDWARHIVDLGPVLGVLFIGYRLLLTATVGRAAWRALWERGDPVAAMLFGFAGVDLLMGQISGHGTVNGYCWLFVGLCLAAARSGQDQLHELSAPAAARMRFPNVLR